MPMYVMKSMQRNRILGALVAALWMAPAAAQTASGAGGATSGSEPDRSGQATAEPDSQTTATSDTGSGGERDRTAVKDSQTTAGTGSTSETSGTTTTAKDQVRSILDEDPGRWPYAGRSSSDRGH